MSEQPKTDEPKVKLYCMMGDAWMQEEEFGDYVKVDDFEAAELKGAELAGKLDDIRQDYDALLKERDELKNKLQQACDVIGGVAMELSKLRVERNALQKDNCEMRDLISNAGIHI